MKTVAVILLAASVSCTAFAQTPAATAVAPMTSGTSEAKREQRNEAHIKSLHAKLRITAAEEPLWEPVAKTMRESVVQIDQVVDKREAALASASAVDDLNAYADIAQAHADSVKKMAAAFAPLYAAMSDDQKKLADGVFTQRAHNQKVARKSEQ